MAVGVGYVLGAWTDATLPAAFLVRPMTTAVVIALVVGGLAALGGKQVGPMLAALVTALIAAPSSWQLPVLLAAICALVWLLRRIRERPDPAIGQTVTLIAAAFAGLGVVQAIPSIAAELVAPRWTASIDSQPPMLVLMVDGYPRADTVAAHGGDLDPFLSALVERDFDYYPAATSPYRFTDQALWGMLRGPDAVVPGTDAEQIRPELTPPRDFLVVDPPVGHVTMWGGDRITSSSITDFEAHLLGRSIVGVVLADAARQWVFEQITGGLRAQIERIEKLPPGRTFAHIVSPHPPFLSGASRLGDCWPATCDAWEPLSEVMGISREDYWRLMNAQIAWLNEMLLELIDATLERSPDAVIVIFSDHGSRWSRDDMAEWAYSFFAARTPGQPDLFAGRARPDATLDVLRSAYR